MASYENSVVIDVPLSEVFAYVNDPMTMPDLIDGLLEVHNLIGTGEGQQYEWTYKMAGILLRGQSIVVDFVADESSTHQAIGMIQSSWTNLLEAHGDGTKLTVKIEYEIPVAVLDKLTEPLTIRRNARTLDSTLLSIKETLESRKRRVS